MGQCCRCYMANSRHGYSLKIVLEMWAAQCGRCAICKIRMATGGKNHWSMARDHDHDTDAPRGLLCMSCNFALGIYEESQRRVGLRIQQYEDYLNHSGLIFI